VEAAPWPRPSPCAASARRSTLTTTPPPLGGAAQSVVEKVGEHLGDPVRVHDHVPGDLITEHRDRRRVCSLVTVGDRLEVRAQRPDRGAHLVGDIAEHLGAAQLDASQVGRHRVEGRGELVELGAPDGRDRTRPTGGEPRDMTSTTRGHNDGGTSHVLGMLGVRAVVIVVLLVAGRSLREALPLAAGLACPILMIGMMFTMRNGDSHPHGEASSADRSDHAHHAGHASHDAATERSDRAAV
jgi:hypothetical protein